VITLLLGALYVAIGIAFGLRLAHVDPIGGQRDKIDYVLGAATCAGLWPMFLLLAVLDRDVPTSTGEPLLPRRYPRTWEGELEEDELWPGERALDAKLDALLAEDCGPAPEYQIVLWTPEEREIFGHNDRMRFIEETDRILNELQWQRLKAEAKQAQADKPDLSTMRIPPSRQVNRARRLNTAQVLGLPLDAAIDDEEEVVHVYVAGQVDPVRTYTMPF